MTHYINYHDVERRLANHDEFTGSSARGVIGPTHINPGGMGVRLNEEERARLEADQQESGLSYVVYSYNTPIAWVTNDGDVHVVEQSFSRTTTRIQNLCRRVLL